MEILLFIFFRCGISSNTALKYGTSRRVVISLLLGGTATSSWTSPNEKQVCSGLVHTQSAQTAKRSEKIFFHLRAISYRKTRYELRFSK